MSNHDTIGNIKSEFSSMDEKVHKILREVLWVIYPRPETTGEGSEDFKNCSANDKLSDECAAMLVDSLKIKGIDFIERLEPYKSKNADVPLDQFLAETEQKILEARAKMGIGNNDA
jgi:hypothetical protein